MISPLYFVAVIVLVCLSAFFSASEMSFSSCSYRSRSLPYAFAARFHALSALKNQIPTATA